MSEKEITFIGKITAGVTHEINNALASIKEKAGLMEDLISMSSNESTFNQEKFLKILPKIEEQVLRGVKLTTQLNKFSHLTDGYKVQVELNDIIEHLVFLTQRFSRINNVELIYKPINQTIRFTTFAIQLQMALYNCVCYFIKITALGGRIIIKPYIEGMKLSIQISLDGEIENSDMLFNDTSSSEELLILHDVICTLEGSTEFDKSTQTIKLSFNINQ